MTRFSLKLWPQILLWHLVSKTVGCCRLYLASLNKNIDFIPYSFAVVDVSSPSWRIWLPFPSCCSCNCWAGPTLVWEYHSQFYKNFFNFLRLPLSAGYPIYTPLKVICSISYQFIPILFGIPDWILWPFLEIYSQNLPPKFDLIYYFNQQFFIQLSRDTIHYFPPLELCQ